MHTNRSKWHSFHWYSVYFIVSSVLNIRSGSNANWPGILHLSNFNNGRPLIPEMQTSCYELRDNAFKSKCKFLWTRIQTGTLHCWQHYRVALKRPFTMFDCTYNYYTIILYLSWASKNIRLCQDNCQFIHDKLSWAC